MLKSFQGVRLFVLCLVFILNIWKAVGQEDLVSGLFFSSHEVIQDKRTSLDITPDNPLKMPKGFSMEFEANFREGDGYYGYIFRIIGDGRTNIDLVSNLASADANFWLIVNDQILSSYKWSDIPNGEHNKWLKIDVDIDTKESLIVISFNGIEQIAKVSEIQEMKRYDISFGACKKKSYSNADVCPMSLKNISIYDEKDKLKRFWKLSRHGKGSNIYDIENNAKAVVRNPKWYIDKHLVWDKRKEIQMNKLLGIATDVKNGRLFFVDENNLILLDCESWETDTIFYKNGAPYHDELTKQIVYNPFTNELWSYSFDVTEINRFNFYSNSWTCEKLDIPELNYAHNNKFISPVDSSLVSIFGYGHYKYHSIVNHFNKRSNHWEQIDRSDQVCPRYLSSAGPLNKREILVFGGYGSKSGRQELSPGFYYDLYVFNLKDFSFKKLWSLPYTETSFVPCENLIYIEDLNCFYTLVFNSLEYDTYLQLARFDVENPSYELFADSIPFNFMDTESWVNLLLNEETSELVASVSHESGVSVYSMAYPPLMSDEVYQDYEQGENFLLEKWWIAFIILTIGLILVTVFMKFRLHKRKPFNRVILNAISIDSVPVVERNRVSSVYFINGFQLFNRQGEDITSEFSPTMKNLFIYILLKTVNNAKGVSAHKIDEILWYDKSEKSARNNRNVNISKLRYVVGQLDGVEVVNDGLYWKISINHPAYSDYQEVLNIIENFKDGNISVQKIQRLVGLLSKGDFIPNVNDSWIDPFKSEFADKVIDSFSLLLSTEYLKSNLSLRYHVSNCLFAYDPLNERALAIKCQILIRIGKRSSAKHIYDSFCIEYNELLGEKYSIPFKELINTNEETNY